MATVIFDKVVKAYDNGVTVLHDINLDVKNGEFVVFVGPSGCGKSTLMRMLAGLENVTRGEIAIDGRRVDGLAPREREIAMVFQDYALYPHKTVFENMAFGLRLRKMPKAEIESRVNEAAEMLQLKHLLDHDTIKVFLRLKVIKDVALGKTCLARDLIYPRTVVTFSRKDSRRGTDDPLSLALSDATDTARCTCLALVQGRMLPQSLHNDAILNPN